MKISLACLAFFLLLFSFNPAFAIPDKRYDPTTQTCRTLTFFNSGWVSEGNKVFQTSCKICHHLKSETGAPFLHTESKSMKGWNRVFAERYPECARNGSWGRLSQEEILKLNDFLYRNAWGTYDPNNAESCG